MGFDPPLTATEVESAVKGLFHAVLPIQVGGQGAVFKAVATTKSGTVVALKIYHPDQIEERSAREVKALKALRGETIVSLQSSGVVRIRGEKCPYLATTFVDGEVLSSRIARGALDVPMLARIGHDVALAIDLMWGARIVHRDIKPSNIMLATDGRAVLIDLGLARHLSLQSLTSTGRTWGTEGYLSPEQARTLKQLSCHSDVFSLGIVLQECLTGRHPTARRQPLLTNGGPDTATLRSGLPPALVQTINAMVGRQSHTRPLPQAVAAALTALI